MNRIIALSCGICLLLNSASIWAAADVNVPLPGGYLNEQYSAGSGANAAYFVVDFGATDGNTYGFAYHWDGTQTADNAMLAIDAAGAFDMTYNDFGSAGEPNLFLDKLTYPPDSSQPDYNVDGSFWDYYLGTYANSNVSWSVSNYGISGRDFNGDIVQTLANGAFYGFRVNTYDENFNPVGGPPVLPVAVPEPATILLAAVGGLLLICRSGRQRRLLLRDAVESSQAPHEIACR
jgi:hypothetical protein